jgi:hypothetical protein
MQHTVTGARSSSGSCAGAPGVLVFATLDATDRVYYGGDSGGGFKLSRCLSNGASAGAYQDSVKWAGFRNQRAGTAGGRVLVGTRGAGGPANAVLALKEDMTVLPGFPRDFTGSLTAALDSANQVLVSSSNGAPVSRINSAGTLDADFTAGATTSCTGATLPIVAVQALDNKPIVSVGTASAFVLKRLWQ